MFDDDLIVVIPGIMGSVLKRGQIPLWDTSVRTLIRDLRNFADFTEQLRLPADLGDASPEPPFDLEPAGLLGGWHVWPGQWVGAGYHDFVAWLSAGFPGRVVEFGYDWRLSVRATAGHLQTFVERALAQWRQSKGRPEAKAVLVCHSMGGLIAHFYVNALQGAESTARIITIGTPFAGSVKAVRNLVGGVPFLPESLVDTMLTFPSVRQLLPTFRCMRTQTGMEAIGASGLPGISSDMIVDAFKLRAECAPRPGGPPVLVLGGYRHSTLASIQIEPQALVFHDTWLETQGGRLVEKDHGGDATVPRFAAVPSESGTDMNAHFVPSRHSALVNNDVLRQRVFDAIECLDPRSFLASDTVFGLDLPDVVSAREHLVVQAVADRPDLKLSVSVRDTAGKPLPGAANLPMVPDGAGRYRTELRVLPGVWNVEAMQSGAPATRTGDLVVVSDL